MFGICSVDVICTNATTLINEKSSSSTQVPIADFYEYKVTRSKCHLNAAAFLHTKSADMIIIC